MTSPDPRQAVLDRLCEVPGIFASPEEPRPGSQFGVAAPVSSAQRDSVRFRKERQAEALRLYAVSFVDLLGQPWQCLVGVTRQDNGSWKVGGAAGGSGDGDLAPERPWVNFAGWWGAGLFCAGGEVIGVGAKDASHVCLVFADGSTLTDDVEHGVVLFVAEHDVVLPATARVLDNVGVVLATHPAID